MTDFGATDSGAYAPALAVDPPPATRIPRRPAVFFWAIFAMALVAPYNLWRPFLDRMAADGARLGPVFLLMTIPALLTLVWAHLSDRVPLFGTRREGYLLVASATSVAAWVAAAFVPPSMGPLLAVTLGLGTGSAVAAPAVYGALVELSRRRASSGRYAALMVGATALAGLFLRVIQRELYQRPVGWTAALGVAVSLSVAVAVILSEDRAVDVPASSAVVEPPRARLQPRSFWTIGAIAGFGLALPQVLGRTVLPALGATDDDLWLANQLSLWLHLGAAVAYLFLARRIGPGMLLRGSLVAVALGWLGLLAATRGQLNVVAALVAREAPAGFGAAALIHVCLRASPPGREAFVYVLLARVPFAVAPILLTPLALLPRSQTGAMVVGLAAALLAALAVSLLPASLLARPDPTPPAH